jgi:cytochrome b6-f complex iron-sulfur subunit
MSSAAVIAIAVAVVVVLGAIALVTLARRSDVRGAGALSGETRKRDEAARRARADAESLAVEPVETRAAGASLERAPDAAPVPWTPPDPEAIGVSRRMFLNRATVALTGTGLGAFAAASFVAFLWPGASSGFGQKVSIGKIDSINDGITTGQGFYYAPSARSWLTHYPSEALPKAKAVYSPAIYAGMADYGLVALYQKCPHLGCRVPSCTSSGWFECPCHGSQYNQVGEKKAGPAPRGMDRFVISVDAAGTLSIDTSTPITGPVIGTNTTGQEAQGPHCITGAGKH